MFRMFCIFLICIILTCHAAVAQQQPDPEFLSRAIPVLQLQRNQALDAAAAQQARADGLANELAKAKAKIDELKTSTTKSKK